MFTKMRQVVLPLTLALALLLSACGAAGQNAVSKVAPEKIIIGNAIALSGPNAPAAALSQIPSYDLWVDDVNAAGGIYVKEFDKKIPDHSFPRALKTALSLFDRCLGFPLGTVSSHSSLSSQESPSSLLPDSRRPSLPGSPACPEGRASRRFGCADCSSFSRKRSDGTGTEPHDQAWAMMSLSDVTTIHCLFSLQMIFLMTVSAVSARREKMMVIPPATVRFS